MGYWDKKEASTRKSRWGDDEPPKKPKSGDQINFEALDQMEKDFNDKADFVGSEVAGIAKSIDKQKARSHDLLSTGYWFSVVFNNETQKRQFLRALKLTETDTFIFGDDMARACHVNINEPDHDYTERKRRDTLTRLARLKEQLELEEKQKSEMEKKKK